MESNRNLFDGVRKKIRESLDEIGQRSGMTGDSPIQKIRRGFSLFVGAINYLGLASCFVMVFVVAIDVIIRKLSGASLSIKGSNEFSAYFMVVIVMLAIPTLRITKGHVWVSMFVDKLPPRVRSWWIFGLHLIELVVFAMLAYSSALKLSNFVSTGTTTDVLNMPKWPFALVCFVGFAEMTIFMIIDSIQVFTDAAHRKPIPKADEVLENHDVF